MRRTAKTTSNKKVGEIPSPFYRLIDNGIIKKQHRKRNRNSRKTNTNVHFSTTNNLKELSSLEIDYLLGAGLFATEEIEGIIKAIYPQMREELSAFEGTILFNDNTPPIDFLYWMLSSYRDYYPGIDWSIEKNESQGSLVLFRYHEYNEIEEGGHAIPLNFLPAVRKKNTLLFDIFCGMFSLMRRTLRVPFYFDDEYGELEYAIDVAENSFYEYTEEDEKKSLQEYIDCYKSGDAFQIGEIIKGETIDFNTLTKIILDFKHKNRIEKKCIEFIKDCMIFIDEFKDDSFHSYVFVSNDEEEDGTPINPYDYAQFAWSFNEDDPIVHFIEESNQMRYQESYLLPFRWTSFGKKNEPTNFPNKYIDILGKGIDIVNLFPDTQSRP